MAGPGPEQPATQSECIKSQTLQFLVKAAGAGRENKQTYFKDHRQYAL